ncbi:MAG TPA: Sir2 family NAD-dependent protein deacetylase [Acidimicrobiales bacterium]|jgi:NAD-dependent deacetylase|nr:Sir2 family NAD-dependent protein deacetylase [Acidimicrobiales bacterium]
MDPGADPEAEASLGIAKRLLAEAGSVVVLTGAGISTDSGIPDFRGPNGVWTKNPEAEKLATLSAYLADPELRRRAWRNRLESPTWSARPNVSHLALARLAASGKLHTLVTQNIDGLHQAAGTDPGLIVEIHGTMHQVMCMSCDRRSPMAETLDRVRGGEEDPACPGCGGILKSATISFGQNLVVDDLERATRAASECDLLLAIGSSLGVFPAAGLVPTARAHGAALVIVNAEATDFDPIADAVVRTPIGEAIPALVG